MLDTSCPPVVAGGQGVSSAGFIRVLICPRNGAREGAKRDRLPDSPDHYLAHRRAGRVDLRLLAAAPDLSVAGSGHPRAEGDPGGGQLVEQAARLRQAMGGAVPEVHVALASRQSRVLL